jgi:GcrA cell cycle regulator
MIWTDDDVQLMKKLIADGISATVVGQRFGVTRSAIIGKLNRLKIKIGDLNGFNNSGKMLARIEAKKLHRIRPRLALYGDWHPPRKTNVVTIKPKTKPKPVVNLDHKCTIMQLKDKTCHWPLWGMDDKNRFYCGAPVTGKTYCEAHHAMGRRFKAEPSEPLVTNSLPAKSPKSMVT